LLAPVAPLLARADLAMVNLETAITQRGEPVPGKAFHFRSPPESFVALKAAGVDVVTMANNHALDYGPIGMEDTFDAIAHYRFP
jgi:poly-gamma-glutamate synthesis protein (capsule biosynthesis protein)